MEQVIVFKLLEFLPNFKCEFFFVKIQFLAAIVESEKHFGVFGNLLFNFFIYSVFYLMISKYMNKGITLGM